MTQASDGATPIWRHRIVLALVWCAALGVLAWGLLHNSGASKLLGLALLAAAILLSRHNLLDLLIDDLPRWLKNPHGKAWQGEYFAFDNQQIRVLAGVGDTPSFVVLSDICAVLGLHLSATDLRRLGQRFGTSMRECEDLRAEGRWMLEDAAALDYVRSFLGDRKAGGEARRFLLWLERTVFRPIDNRRTRETGRPYRFTKDSELIATKRQAGGNAP